MTDNSKTEKKSFSLGVRMVLSALGGMGAATVCHPIDVIRVQMQLFKFNNSVHAVRSIVSNGGVFGLYNGVSAAYLRQWTYGACRMGFFTFQLDMYKRTYHVQTSEVPFSAKAVMGALSGGIGSFIGNPTEVALVRMGADSKLPSHLQRNYKSVFDCIFRMIREEGVYSLWRGAVPTVTRSVLSSASTQAIYSEMKPRLKQAHPVLFNHPNSLQTMFASSVVGSFVANVMCTPFDVVKSRLQHMPKPLNGEKPLYTGMMDCFAKGLKEEGPMFLYRGFTPLFLKLAPYTTLSLMFVDKLTVAFGGEPAY